jgi:hypothetical protein
VLYLPRPHHRIDFNLASIPVSLSEREKEPFDLESIYALFDVGYDLGRHGYHWQKPPPDFQSSQRHLEKFNPVGFAVAAKRWPASVRACWQDSLKLLVAASAKANFRDEWRKRRVTITGTHALRKAIVNVSGQPTRGPRLE